MESVRAVSGMSADPDRAAAVDGASAASRVRAPDAVPQNERPAKDARVEVKAPPMPTMEMLRENFREAIDSANERLADRGASINVSIDKSTDTVIVQVKDRDSGETIRQIPPEAAMQVSRNIERLTGILVDRKA